jgi:hypothetical protein
LSNSPRLNCQHECCMVTTAASKQVWTPDRTGE